LDKKELAHLWQRLDKDVDDNITLQEMKQLWKEANDEIEEAAAMLILTLTVALTLTLTGRTC